MKLAFVIQRYGAEVLGGSEQLCRLVAERLAAQHDVDVLTTCARDYVTWKNEYPEGADRVKGVTVRRFASARTRDIDAFNTYSNWIFNNPHTRADEMEWLKQQGPWCPALIDFLRRNHHLTDSERRFVQQQFPDRPLLEELVGVGIDIPHHQPYPRMPERPEDEGSSAGVEVGGPEVVRVGESDPLCAHRRVREEPSVGNVDRACGRGSQEEHEGSRESLHLGHRFFPKLWVEFSSERRSTR